MPPTNTSYTVLRLALYMCSTTVLSNSQGWAISRFSCIYLSGHVCVITNTSSVIMRKSSCHWKKHRFRSAQWDADKWEDRQRYPALQLSILP